ncbi:MAG: asparaginase [Arcobacteraceae bacterium]|nr:asparaginase [Arcobacteraceae bacterium]
MQSSNKILIINTGGTFNKQYNLLNGKLEINKNNLIIENILNNIYYTNIKPKIQGMIYKDSLDILEQDRKELVKVIKKSKYKNIVIVHGTDTMDKTAIYLNKKIKNKKIVLVGAMQPFELEPIESTASLMMAIGFLNTDVKNNIYISMSGIIAKHNKIKKNYKKGLFECR